MPTYLFLRRLRRSPAAFSGLTLVILLVPVSYTHLTLPTICSV